MNLGTHRDPWYQVPGYQILVPRSWYYVLWCYFFTNKSGNFDLKCVQMARYELILKLNGAIWLRIIAKPLLTQKLPIKIQQ